MIITRRVIALAAALACAAPWAAAQAQGYPTRNITLVVPFAAGGPSDSIARIIAQSMSTTLGQPVIVENVAGAGGTVGAARIAKAEPDGYSLLIHHIALPAAASLYKTLSYDTARAFETIGLVNAGPMVLTARKDYAASTPAELFAKLKAEGLAVTMAHAGVGSNANLCGLLLQQALGVKLTEVAYRGTGPAMNDLMGGRIDVLCDQSTNAVPQVEAGTIKAYAVTSATRLEVLPNLPTLQEAGVPGFEFSIWHGLYAPRGTPITVIEKLNGALRTALADASIQQRFASFGTQIFPAAELSAAAHRTRFEKEIATWRDVIAKSGVAAN